MRFVLTAAVLMCLWGSVAAQAAPAKINPNDPTDLKASQALFERVFGEYARLDPAREKMIVDEAKKYGLGQGEPAVGAGARLSRGARPGAGAGARAANARTTPTRQRQAAAAAPAQPSNNPVSEGRGLIDRQGAHYYYDTDHDGQPDEVWFIDVQVRAPEAAKPILVRVIDQGGDLVQGGEPDQVNDLYIVDWKADGIVDSVIEYKDLNGDGGAEQEIMYWVGPTFNYFDGDRMRALVYTDLSGTHAFFHLYGYKYDQPQGQWHTPFGPDQIFHSYVFEPDKNMWVTYWEYPFGFYDLDRDGSPEEAIRFSGAEGMIDSYRHSFDAVNAAPGDGTERHYDVSISATAPGGQWDSWTPKQPVRRGESNLKFNPLYTEPFSLRGIPAQQIVPWDKVRSISNGVVWARTMFTWIEDGNNSDPADTNFNERWEGVITTRILTPEQQKIEEAANADKGDRSDLKKAPTKKGTPIAGAMYTRENTIFPRIGSPDCGEFNRRFELILKPERPVSVYYQPVDQRIHITDADQAWTIVDFDRDGKADMAYQMFDRNNDGVIDRWTVDVNADGKVDDEWSAARGVRIERFPYAWQDVNAHMKPVIPAVPQMLYAINLQLEKALEKSNASAKDPLADLLNNSMRCPTIPDKLAKKYVSSDEGLRYWLDALKDRRIVALRKELKNRGFWKSFDTARSRGDLAGMLQALVNLNGVTSEPPEKLYKEWTGKLRSNFKTQQVGYKFLNQRGNVCWESMETAYRIYNGQFDLYAKYEPRLITRLKNWGNYHHEQSWGMDCFLLGSTAGLGGVTLFVNDKPYPVRNPSEVEKPGDIHFSASLVEFTSDTVTIEFKGEGVGPKKAYTVTWHVTARGGHRESMNEVTVTGGNPEDKIQIGLEMTRLPKETYLTDTGKGVMASRGFMGPEIGWIGLGMIFMPDQLIRLVDTDTSHMALVKAQLGRPVTYYTQNEWVRGRKYSFGPTAQDWFKEMQEVSDKVSNE